jgi:hypothetical protein
MSSPYAGASPSRATFELTLAPDDRSHVRSYAARFSALQKRRSQTAVRPTRRSCCRVVHVRLGLTRHGKMLRILQTDLIEALPIALGSMETVRRTIRGRSPGSGPTPRPIKRCSMVPLHSDCTRQRTPRFLPCVEELDRAGEVGRAVANRDRGAPGH